MKRENAERFLPLSPAMLHLLLALAGQDLHGYGIMQEISRQSDGKYKLGPGSLYDNLQKAICRNWVMDLGHRAGDDDPRRRYYRLASPGAAILASEMVRLETVIRDGRARLRIPKPRRA